MTYTDIAIAQKQLAGFEFDYAPLLDVLLDRVSCLAGESHKIVELGAFLGCSTAYLAGKLKSMPIRPQFFTVDTFGPYARVPNVYQQFLQNMAQCDLLGYVCPIAAKSWDAASLFADRSVAFLWVDADHRYESVVKDLAAWRPKIADGGVIAGHDYSEPGVARAVDEFSAAEKKTINVFNPGGWRSWWVQL